MGKGQRVKGAVYEREVMAAFSDALHQTFKRHIGQARDGGHDGVADMWVIECKRRKNLKTLEGWMAQAQAAADKLDILGLYAPVVVMRSDGGESMALLKLDDFLALIETPNPEVSA